MDLERDKREVIPPHVIFETTLSRNEIYPKLNKFKS
jgi:hypothetical protein